MSMSDPLNNLGSILYHSKSLEVPYSSKQYLDRDFFCHFLQQGGSIFCMYLLRLRGRDGKGVSDLKASLDFLITSISL